MDAIDPQIALPVAIASLVMASVIMAIALFLRRRKKKAMAELHREYRHTFIQDAADYFGVQWGPPVAMTHAERMRIAQARLEQKKFMGREAVDNGRAERRRGKKG